VRRPPAPGHPLVDPVLRARCVSVPASAEAQVSPSWVRSSCSLHQQGGGVQAGLGESFDARPIFARRGPTRTACAGSGPRLLYLRRACEFACEMTTRSAAGSSVVVQQSVRGPGSSNVWCPFAEFSLGMTGGDVSELVGFVDSEDLATRVGAARAVGQTGFVPAPIIAARRLSSEGTLREFLGTLQTAGWERQRGDRGRRSCAAARTLP
jgi:hypothetical protein